LVPRSFLTNITRKAGRIQEMVEFGWSFSKPPHLTKNSQFAG
jgi:hypothetical protein